MLLHGPENRLSIILLTLMTRLESASSLMVEGLRNMLPQRW